MGETILYGTDGKPLLWWEDRPEGYRRNAMGFQPPEAREQMNAATRPPLPPQPVEAHCCSECTEDAQAVEVDFEGF